MKIASLVRKRFMEKHPLRLRNRRGHYASGIMSDMRDQYWSWTGEKETNPPDLAGHVKMWLGNAIEKGLVDNVLRELSTMGLHIEGTQVPIGGSKPNFDGYLDAMISETDESGNKKYYVVEVKSKSGFGADLLMRSMVPSDEYMAQMAVYLREAHKRGITNEGIFIYVLLSNDTVGDILFVSCRFDPEMDEVIAYSGESLLGKHMALDYHFDASIPEQRALKLEQHLKDKIVPECEYPYKAKLTQEFLSSLSDKDISMAIKGQKILGSWQGRYSRYLQKRIETDGDSRQYSEQEIEILRKHYLTRHPKSKI
jgi:hypothetical protein